MSRIILYQDGHDTAVFLAGAGSGLVALIVTVLLPLLVSPILRGRGRRQQV